MLTDKIVGEPNQYEVDESLTPVSIESGSSGNRDDIKDESEEDLYKEAVDDPEPEDDKTENEDDLVERGTPEYDEDVTEEEPEEAKQKIQEGKPDKDKKSSKGQDATDDEGTSVNAPGGDARNVGDGGDGAEAPYGVGEGDEDSGSGPGQEPEPKQEPADGGSEDPPEQEPEGDEGRGRAITIEDPQDERPDDGSHDAPPSDDGGSDTPEKTFNPVPDGDGGGSGPDDADNPGRTHGDDGTYADIPTAGKIAAAGPYATIVQALGGKGSLAAVNRQWWDDLPNQAFGGRGTQTDELDGVKVVGGWGDGKSLTSEAIDQIIDSGAEVFLNSATYGGVDATWQLDKLLDAGIDVISMPPIGVADASDADVKQAVAVVGRMLGSKESGVSGKTSLQLASDWSSMHDDVLNATKTRNGGYTCYLADGESRNWLYQGTSTYGGDKVAVSSTAKRYYSVYIDGWRSSKTSVFQESRTYNMMGAYPFLQDAWLMPGTVDDYTCYVDATEGVGAGVEPSGIGNAYPLVEYYLQHAGVTMTDNGRMRKYTDVVHFNNESLGFPIYHHDTLWIYNRGRHVDSMGYETVYPGCEDGSFPAILVRNREIAERVQRSAQIDNPEQHLLGLYNYGCDYSIVIVPSGISGSWVDGNFESFLAAPWAYCLYQEPSLSFSDSFVSRFYEEFYRCNAAGLIDASGNYGGSGVIAARG